jgi:ankyrin repeat protein
LSASELKELRAAFSDVDNYDESEDPLAPIDPLTYRAPDDDSCLHIAIWRGDLRSVELLIKAGLDVNAIGDMSETPLHVAITQQSLPIIERLLRAGAKSDIRSEFGRTAAEMAEAAGGEIGILFGHGSGDQ